MWHSISLPTTSTTRRKWMLIFPKSHSDGHLVHEYRGHYGVGPGYFLRLNRILNRRMTTMSSKTLMPVPIKPPFNTETALLKVQAAEDAWNSRDPERVSLAYSLDSEWRNRNEFLRGRDEIKAFLRRKWAKELEYRLK